MDVLRIEKLPMELLILLVERRGELVSREEIADRLWGKDVFVDVDHSINVAIRKVRAALRDDPEKPRFVETVVGKGYRFAAPVICGNGDSNSRAPSAVSPVETPSGEAVQGDGIRRASVRLKLALAVVAIMVLLATALIMKRGARSGSAAQPAIQSLAVLPLKNLSGDPKQEYFVDGMTEELIGRLSNIRGLRVISRTSVMGFKDTRKSVPEIARALHVDALVEGSVLREGNQVRVRVQLIRGASDEHIWTNEYQREYGSILALQGEVTRTIAQQIRLTVTPLEQTRPEGGRTVDPQVYENYLKGRYYFNERTTDSLNKSISYFQQALAGNPDYALAYCGLADAYAVLGFRGAVPSKDALSRAKAAAIKAIELDTSLADPHASLAFIAETHEWDWATAEREYKRALELNPGDARTHHWFAGYLTYTGQVDQGIEEEKRARGLDPLSLPINTALAGRLLVAGRYDEALAQLRETLEINPHFAPAHQTLGWVYLNTRRYGEAIQEFQQALQISGDDEADFLLDLGFAYAVGGNREEAQKVLAKLKNLHERALVPSGAIGILYGALGDFNEAFAWLDKAYAEHDPELTYLKVPNRRFGPLLHDARYQALVRRIGLPG